LTIELFFSVQPPPVITEEVTSTIEEIIKKRIKEEAWDDVIRKKEIETKFKPKIELNHEKSKLGLAEEYEQEYMKKAMEVEGKDELDEEHKEIEELFKKLCHKLDSLSNFNYTPRRLNDELKVISNVPAIQMEEIVPVSMSEAAVLAPQEIYDSKKTQELKAENELSQQERKRRRKVKKEIRKKEQKKKEADKKAIQKLDPNAAKPESREQLLKKIAGKVRKKSLVFILSGFSFCFFLFVSNRTRQLWKERIRMLESLRQCSRNCKKKRPKESNNGKNKPTSHKRKLRKRPRPSSCNVCIFSPLSIQRCTPFFFFPQNTFRKRPQNKEKCLFLLFVFFCFLFSLVNSFLELFEKFLCHGVFRFEYSGFLFFLSFFAPLLFFLSFVQLFDFSFADAKRWAVQLFLFFLFLFSFPSFQLFLSLFFELFQADLSHLGRFLNVCFID
jgi:hypothetical protein